MYEKSRFREAPEKHKAVYRCLFGLCSISPRAARSSARGDCHKGGARMSEKFKNIEARSRYFRCLLYPDNELHSLAIEKLKEYADDYVGITHTEQDGEKEHQHYVLIFKNPRKTATVCRELGFVDGLDMPDDQFVRAIVKQQKRKVDSQLKDCLIYLTHRNAPEKEQYEVSQLIGSPEWIKYTAKQIQKYESQEFDMCDSVSGILDWIAAQDGIIKAYTFGKFVTNSPYFKANSNKIVWAALKEHNLRVYNDQHPVPDHFDCVVPDFAEITEQELAQMNFIYCD